MLTFDKALTFFPILKSNLLVNLNAKTCDLAFFLIS